MEIKSVQQIVSSPELLIRDILLDIVNFDRNLLHASRDSGIFLSDGGGDL